MHALAPAAQCLLLLPLVTSAPAGPGDQPIAYYDMTELFALDLNDPAQLREFWDTTHLVVSLQGLANRSAPRLYIRYVQDPDDFWWDVMVREGGWLAGREVVRVTSLVGLLERFRDSYGGAVVWDERVPATSNLASTIAGSESLLCLRYDPSPESLYGKLTRGAKAKLDVKVDLRAPDGDPMFTGSGTIVGTDLPSSRSAKCDAYLWLIEKYVNAGNVNPAVMGYYLDGFWLKCWQAGDPRNHTLTNQDYVIANRGILFDLGVWGDESPIDDPGQPPGTDERTMCALLRAAYDRLGGDGTIHVAGFVPWGYKYTNWSTPGWSAGGKRDGVPCEWRYAEVLSCFNAYMDADALGLSAMANASFFQHFPLREHYPQPSKPTRESLTERGILDKDGQIVNRGYYSHYVGDYDSAAWLYRMLPGMWADDARGSVPLSWAFNPNLCQRFPLGMDWARRNATASDFFIAGDSGAGYLNPGFLSEPRPFSGLPSGVAAWERHCAKLYAQWDIPVTGFVIDGFARGLSADGLDAYARFSPGGIVAQKIGQQGVHNGMPYLRMGGDLPHDPVEAAKVIEARFGGRRPQFAVYRSILKRPSWYAAVDAEVFRRTRGRAVAVDMNTLMWLLKEYENHKDEYAPPASPYAGAEEVSAAPEAESGVRAVYWEDGPFTVEDLPGGGKAWRLPLAGRTLFLYFDVEDDFLGNPSPLSVEVEYLDQGSGSLRVEYDSADPSAAIDGAYKGTDTVRREGSGAWRTAGFAVSVPLLKNRQNGGADLRLAADGDPLLVRRVVVRRTH